MSHPLYRVLAGVDLGQWQHQLCALHPSGEFWVERAFSHSTEGLTAAVDWLLNLAKHHTEAIAVAIEKPHGAVVETLLESGIAVFAINPKQVDRFRDRHSMSGAKDDRRDAFVLADALRTDGHRFQRLQLPPPEIIAMRGLLITREQLVKNHVALSSQIRDLLLRRWPHIVSLAPKDKALDSFFCELLQLFLDAPKNQLLTPRTIQELVKKHHIRRVKPQQILETLQKAPLRVAPATTKTTSTHLKLLLQQLLLVRQHRRDSDQHLERWFKQIQRTVPPYTDAAILASLPGVGPYVLASVLSYAHEPVRLQNFQAFRSLGGIAPVTKQSGKRRQVLLRRACSQPLNNALYHWARIAVLRDTHSRQHYDQLRDKGHGHARALRGVMDRILTITIAMLRDRTLYDPSRRSTNKRRGYDS
jgi:transposase